MRKGEWSRLLAAAQGPVDVSSCAKRTQVALARRSKPEVKEALAKSKGLSQQAMAILASSLDMGVSRTLALRHDLGEEAADILARHPDSHTRHRLASNSYTPRSVVGVLAKDVDGPVAQAAVMNPQCPRASLEEAAKRPGVENRSAVADNPTCHVSILHQLARKERARNGYQGAHKALRRVLSGQSRYPSAQLDGLKSPEGMGEADLVEVMVEYVLSFEDFAEGWNKLVEVMEVTTPEQRAVMGCLDHIDTLPDRAVSAADALNLKG